MSSHPDSWPQIEPIGKDKVLWDALQRIITHTDPQAHYAGTLYKGIAERGIKDYSDMSDTDYRVRRKVVPAFDASKPIDKVFQALEDACQKHPVFATGVMEGYMVLGEEVGEIAKALNDGDLRQALEEVSQTGAVCLRYIPLIEERLRERDG